MKKFSFSLIILSLLLIAGFTAYKVINQHNHNLLMVSEKRIVEAALKCVNEDKCTGDKVTLATLYQNNYLEQEINPLTKEIYNKDSYVEINEKNFIVVN